MHALLTVQHLPNEFVATGVSESLLVVCSLRGKTSQVVIPVGKGDLRQPMKAAKAKGPDKNTVRTAHDHAAYYLKDASSRRSASQHVLPYAARV